MPDNFDIFISYRRVGGFATANHIYDKLTQDGYAVSFDTHNLREGDFDTKLLERIDQCDDFILIVDKHTFDQTLVPDANPNAKLGCWSSDQAPVVGEGWPERA